MTVFEDILYRMLLIFYKLAATCYSLLYVDGATVTSTLASDYACNGINSMPCSTHPLRWKYQPAALTGNAVNRLASQKERVDGERLTFSS